MCVRAEQLYDGERIELLTTCARAAIGKELGALLVRNKSSHDRAIGRPEKPKSDESQKCVCGKDQNRRHGFAILFKAEDPHITESTKAYLREAGNVELRQATDAYFQEGNLGEVVREPLHLSEYSSK